MKKTRLLASLLCVMMVVCSLPLMQVSATGTTGYNSVDDVVGKELMPEITFTFNGTEFVVPEGIEKLHTVTNCTYSVENGVTLGSSAVFRPTEGSYTTPMNHPAMTFKIQVPEDGGSVTFRATHPEFEVNHNDASNQRKAEFSVSATGVNISGIKVAGPDSTFVPGNEWVDYLVVPAADTYSVYAKNDNLTDGKWVLLKTAEWYAGGAGQGFRWDGSNVNVKDINIYRETHFTFKSVIGADVATAYDFDFKADFDGTMQFTDTWAAGIETPAGATYTNENGLTLPASARWRFRPYGNTPWSCLSNGGNRSAVMFSMKLPEGGSDTIVSLGSPDYTGRVYLLLNTGKIAVEGGPATTDSTILPGTGWVDYLVVPDSLTGGATSGFALYMRSDSLTGGEWVKKLTNTKYGSAGSANNNTSTGITITAGDANTCVKNLKVLSIDDVVADSATKPAGADYLWYDETFDAEPSYLSANGGNLSVGGGTYDTENSQIVLTNNKGYAQFYLNKAGIPVGGYAEIKVRTGAQVNFSLPTPDASQRIKLDMRKEKGTINNNTTAFIGDGGNTWWTYRILCNSEKTYDVFVKAEGDTAWLQLANDIEAIAPAGTGPDRIAIDQYAHTAGNTADLFSSAIDYIKIYGAAPTAKLTLTDGYGTAALENNGVMTYPRALRAIVTENAGKLLVVKYNGNDMISAEIVDAASMVNDSVIVNAYNTEATKVKVFLWDSFTNLNKLVDAVTLIP